MIPDLQACILCDDVRQERNGKFILIGIFDALASPRLPLRYPRLFLVTRWCSGEGTFEQFTKILMPDQTTVFLEGRKIRTQLASPTASATNVEVFMNAAFPEFGTYWVELGLDGDLKLRFPLRVAKVEAPPGEVGGN
jgi:hypothetical protein